MPTDAMMDVDFAVDTLPDLDQRLSELRATGERIVPVRWSGERAWMVLNYRDVYAVMGDDEGIPARTEYVKSTPTLGHTPLKFKGKEHLESRAVLAAPFKPAEVRARVESLLRPLADELITGFAGRGEVNLVGEYARRYTFRVMSGLLGAPIDDEDRLISLTYALLPPLKKGELGQEQAVAAQWQDSMAAKGAMNDYLRPIVESRRYAPRHDAITYLVHAREGDRPISEEVLFDYIRLLYPAGAETTHMAIVHMMALVLGDPALKQRLIERPGDRAAVVDEALRLSPPVCLLPRILDQDRDVCGVRLDAGTVVLLAIASGNRDDHAYSDPDEFSVDRKGKPVLSFGAGPHHCLGLHLAKAEMLMSLNRLLDRLTGLRLSRPVPPATGGLVRWIPELWVCFERIESASR